MRKKSKPVTKSCSEVGMQKNRKFTKAGPGRTHIQGTGNHSHLTVKQRLSGQFSRDLRAWITAKQLAALELGLK